MDTQKISFDERGDGQPIAFIGSAQTVSDGCEVDLQHNGLKISAKVLKSNEGKWLGEVTDIPASDVDELSDLKIGSTILFEDTNVYRCAA
ncbi:MAG: hypothetical protein IH830_07145 [Planctomycetes bacterium]|nr:hypothetical protein [Planctomycetota bacterium]